MSAGAPDLFAHGTKSGIMSDIDNGVIQVLSHTQKLDFFFFFPPGTIWSVPHDRANGKPCFW